MDIAMENLAQKYDLILLLLFCKDCRERTWHIMGIDGVCRCLPCRLMEVPEQPFREKVPEVK